MAELATGAATNAAIAIVAILLNIFISFLFLYLTLVNLLFFPGETRLEGIIFPRLPRAVLDNEEYNLTT